jgi:hypothetical protein
MQIAFSQSNKYNKQSLQGIITHGIMHIASSFLLLLSITIIIIIMKQGT